MTERANLRGWTLAHRLAPILRTFSAAIAPEDKPAQCSTATMTRYFLDQCAPGGKLREHTEHVCVWRYRPTPTHERVRCSCGVLLLVPREGQR